MVSFHFPETARRINYVLLSEIIIFDVRGVGYVASCASIFLEFEEMDCHIF